MLERVCELCGAGLALAGVSVVAFVLLTRRRSRLSGRCCTARRSLGDAVLPWRVFTVRVCGYSLRGLNRMHSDL